MKKLAVLTLFFVLLAGAARIAQLPPFDPVADNGKVVAVTSGHLGYVLPAFFGVTGPTGAQGAQGNAGDQGAVGPTGPTGAAGTNGVNGSTGPTGLVASVNAGSLVGVTGPTGAPYSIALGGGLNFTAVPSVERSALTGDVSASAGSNSVEVTGLQLMSLPVSPVTNGFLKLNGAATDWEEVAYGSSSNTVCQGNDSRLSDSRIPTGTAGGDLGGTYPSPTVVGIHETGGPTGLTVGSIPDGYYLQRSGTSIVGVNTDALIDLQYFGEYSDGDLTISSGTTTLARDMYYRDVTISSTAQIVMAGFAFRCRTLDLSNAPSGAIVANGSNGNNGSGTSGGSAVAASGNGFGWAGGSGGAQGLSQNQNGGSTTQINKRYGGLLGAGGNGGANDSGTAGGTVLSTTEVTGRGFLPLVTTQFPANTVTSGTVFTAGVATHSAGGGAGGRSGAGGGNGGGGGSSASSGYAVPIFCRTIVRGASTAANSIQANGGAGGNGANGTTSVNQGGGGGGGAGGAGGLIYLVYRYLSGSTAANALRANGGAGGNGGDAGGASAKGGQGGGGSGGGVIQLNNIASMTITRVIGSTGSTTSAAAGASGTVGGSGGTCSSDL